MLPRGFSFPWIALALAAVWAVEPAAAVDDPTPTPDDLAKLARKWTSEDKDLKSVEIAGHYGHIYGFHVLRRENGEVAMYVTSHHDRTPVLVVVHGRAMVWDMLRRQVIVVTSAGPWFDAKVQKKTPTVLCGVRGKTNAPMGYWDFSLDLPAWIAYATEDARVDVLGGGRFRLTGRTGLGGSMTTWFDLNSHPSVYRIEGRDKNGEVVPAIQRIRLNKPVNVAFPALPRKRQLADHFEVLEIDGSKMALDQLGALGVRYMRTVLIRAMLVDERTGAKFGGEEDRATIDQSFGPIDWARAAKHDAADAPRIRELLKLPNAKAATNAPMGADEAAPQE